MITVSGCLILTAANSSSYGWLTKCQFLQDVTVDISLHEVCVRVGVLYVITKFSRMDGLPNFLTHGAPQARASRARELRYNTRSKNSKKAIIVHYKTRSKKLQSCNFTSEVISIT